MIPHRLVPLVLVATLVLVACQTSPPRVRRGVNIACFNALRIHRHLERPASSRVLNIQPQREQNEYLPLARHHIIPYATMRDFYNTMLRSDQAAFTRMFNDVIYPAAENVGVLPTLGALNYEEYELPELGELSGIYLRIATVDQVRLIQEVYAWLPFNIYIGPTPNEREDDERANIFDETSLPIVGNEQADRLRRLYGNMMRYIANGNSVSVNSIIDAMADLVHLRRQPYDFVPSQWRVRSRINRFQFATATDTVRNDQSTYRELRTEDYCRPDRPSQPSYNSHYSGDLLKRRRRFLAGTDGHPKQCILIEDNNDAFCFNTLNSVRESIKDGTFTLVPVEDEKPETVICALGSTCVDEDDVLPDPSAFLTSTGWFQNLFTLGMWPQKG